MSTTVQQLKEIGQAMGLKGSELATFIKEQQILEREEREKLRQEKDKEDERLLKLRQYELQKEDKEKEFALQKAEQEKQEKEKLREFELQRADQEAKEKDKDRQIEIERIKGRRGIDSLSLRNIVRDGEN